MINYVNNAYDKVLKPCDAQKFSIIVNSQETEKHILGHRGGDAKAKSKLPALTYMGVFDKTKWQDSLVSINRQSSQPTLVSRRPPKGGGTRKAQFMRPTGLLMMDFDHQPNPRSTYDALLSYLSAADMALTSVLALAHITPSGDGLRLVLKREKGKSIAQEQYEWFKRIQAHYQGELTFDDVCKDISRLSFAPMKSEILYFNPSLLFGELPEAGDYPDEGAPLFSPQQPPSNPPNRRSTPEGAKVKGGSLAPRCRESSPLGELEGAESFSSELEGAGSFPAEFEGLEYKEIVRRLEEQLGGRPEHGARNSFIFSMACNLRYVCNDDAAWIASILPTYGEDSQKHRMTIQSAVNRPMSREMPETLKRALGVAKACADNSQLTIDNSQLAAPQLPGNLPQPVSLLVERIPERMRAAAAMAVFPALGAYVKDMHLVYADGRDYEPTFMNILVAEQSAGKSAVNKPIDHILAPLKARDEVSLSREREWKEKCAIISTTQDKPERPKGLCVQILPPDMTNAAFVQRLSDADGHFLYTRMDEVELLNALRTNGAANMVSAVLRLAFDCGEYGQVRVAANAVNAMVRVRWNWNASPTVQRVRKYFAKNIADGTLSRLSFATIPESEEDVYSEEFPVYEHYGENYADQLQPYIDRIETCTGTLHCPEAVAWVRALNKELLTFAREAEDSGYARMSRRGILMGFFRAMLLYVMNGCQWNECIERFASWSVKYDLWCKMRFFRDMLRSDIEGERAALQRGPVGLLPLLPQEFTRDDVRALRIAQGMKPDPKVVISKWVARGQVVRDDSRGVFVKRVDS